MDHNRWCRFVISLSVILLPAICSAEDDDLFPVMVDGKYGYIDRSGLIVIQPQFEYGGDFKEGMALIDSPHSTQLVRDGHGTAYIDAQGKIQFRGKYRSYPFQSGRAVYKQESPVLMSKVYGYLDLSGRVAIRAKYDVARDFRDGLALVGILNARGWAESLMTGEIEGPYDYTYIDLKGQKIGPNFEPSELVDKDQLLPLERGGTY